MNSPCTRAAVRLVVVLFCLVFPASTPWSQNENETVGFQSNHLFESGHFGENIDILNGGLNLTIPIGQRYQGSKYLGFQLQLAYGSKLWDASPYPEGSQRDRLIRRSPMGLGFTLHFGRIYKDVELASYGNLVCTWYYVSPDGNQHALEPAQTPGAPLVNPCTTLPTGTTRDTTFWSINIGVLESWNGDQESAPVLQMTSADGRLVYEFGHFIQVYGEGQPLNRKAATSVALEGLETDYNRDFGGWYVTKIYDVTSRTEESVTTAVNKLTITYPPHPAVHEDGNSNAEAYTHVMTNVTDNLDRKVEFETECEPATGSDVGQCRNSPVTGINNRQRAAVRVKTIKLPKFQGVTDVVETEGTEKAEYDFEYVWRSIENPDYQCTPALCPPVTANTLSSIKYPEVDPRSGLPERYEMTFTYSTVGGEIESRFLPTGAEISYVWQRYFYLGGDTRHLVSKRVTVGDQSGLWTYTREGDETGLALTNPKYVTVRDANGNDTKYYYRASGSQPPPPGPPPPEPPPPSAPDFDDGWTPEWDDGINFRIEYFAGNGPSRQLIRSENRAYDSDRDTTTAKHLGDNVRLNYFVTTFEDDGGKQATTEFREWNFKGLWRQTIESGEGIAGVRTTFTNYSASGDASVFYYREVSDGFRVLSRTDNDFDNKGRLVLSADRATVPSQIGRPVPDADDLANTPGDIYTIYTYNDANVAAGHQPVLKEISTQGATKDGEDPWQASNPQYRIRYGYQPGGNLVTKEVFNFEPPCFEEDPLPCPGTPPQGAPQFNTYFPWLAIDRDRDGNTGLIFRSRDTAQAETTYEYDSLGRLTDIIPPAPELETEIEYANIKQTSVRQGPGTTYECSDSETGDAADFILSCYSYDSLGRLTRTQKRAFDGRSVSQETVYSAAGLMLSQTEWHWPNENPCSPAGQCATLFDYGTPVDPFGRVRTVTTADGKETETTYIGQTTLVTVNGIANGNGDETFNATTRYTRDVWGRLTQVLPPPGGGASASYTYDLRDNLINTALTDPTTLAVQTRVFEYDALNRLHASVNPENGAEVITGYDGLGNITAGTDASGNHTLMTYDGAGRLANVKLQEYQKPGTLTPVRRVAQRNSYDGVQTTLWGRLAKSESFDDAGLWVHTRELTYEQLNGRLSKERNYFAGSSGTVALDAAIDYDYNAFGLPNRTVYPEGAPTKGGAFSTVNNYVNGHLTEIHDAALCNPRQPSHPPGTGCPSCIGGQPCVPQARATFNAANGLLEIQTPGDAKTRIEPDSRNRPKQIVVSKLGLPDPLYDSGNYSYDGAGNIHKIGLSRYGYDAANRLTVTQDVEGTTIRDEVYSYDAFGNMTARTLTVGGQPTTDTFNVALNNRVIQHVSGSASNFTYDARGNVTFGDGKVYDMDGRNRAVSLRSRSGTLDTELGRYAYDGGGNRVRKFDRQRDAWLFYVRDAQGRLMSEFRLTPKGTYTPEWLKHHLYLGGRLVGMRENVVPGAPASLSANVTVNGSNATIQLSWSATPQDEAPVGQVYQYKVYRSPNADNPPTWTDLTAPPSGPISTTAFSNVVTKGTWWKYAVTAVVGGQAGYASDPLIVRGGGNTLLTAPTSLVATAGDRRVALKWDQSNNDTLLGYHVYRAVGTDPLARITQNVVPQPAIPTGQKITFVDEGATNGTTYRYRVAAVSPNTESPKSAEVTATPSDFTPPGPPLAVRAVAACDASNYVIVSWEWNLATQGATFTVFRRDSQGQEQSFFTNNASSFTDTSVVADSQYTYWVKAYDASFNLSEESLHVPVRTRAPGVVPMPDRPTVKAGDHVVTVRAPGSAWNMRVYRKRNMDVGCGAYEIITNVWGSQTFSDASVANNAAYDYALANVDSSGRESVLSKAALAIPLSPPTEFSQCVEKIGIIPYEPPPGWQQPWKDGANQCTNQHPTQDIMRALLRWHPSNEPQYQPFSMTNADGIPGYLLGYRLYRFERPDYEVVPGLNTNSLVPVQDDFQKTHCYLHPGIPCQGDATCPQGDRCPGYSDFCKANPQISCTTDIECPPGDDCTYGSVFPNYPQGTCERSGLSCGNCLGAGNEVLRCLGRRTGTCVHATETVCNIDAQCPGMPCEDNVCRTGLIGGTMCFEDRDCSSDYRCRIGAGQDPYRIRYLDAGINTFVSKIAGTPPTDFTGCFSVKAVYRIYADGSWRDVESDFASNFDPADPWSPCLQELPDLCNDVSEGEGPEERLRCAPTRTLPPTPGKPVVTSPSAGTLEVRWDAPFSCEPSAPIECDRISGCAGAGQFCFIDDPNDYDGHCRYEEPIHCLTDDVCVAALGPGHVCESREGEIAGYYVYADEKKVDAQGYDDRRKQRYHFNSDSPVAAASILPRLSTFSNLAPWLSTSNPSAISFRIASYDQSGRISSLTAPSEIVPPQPPGGQVPAPASVKTVIWATTGPAPGSKGIRVDWLPGGNYSNLTGYRLWRSLSDSGPFCALIYAIPSNPSSLQCFDQAILTSSQVSANKLSFIDDTASPGTTYYYAVSALISGGGESVRSAPVVGVLLPSASQPLPPPAAFVAEAPKGQGQGWERSPGDDAITEFAGMYLRWCPNPDRQGVTSYRVYRAAQSMGPYTQIATIPPLCLDSEHRCEIDEDDEPTVIAACASPSLFNPTSPTCCLAGVDGTCRVIDKTVDQAQPGTPSPADPNPDPIQPIYYYVVTAVRGVDPNDEESAYSVENQGWPNYDPGGTGTWKRVYDPDNSPETICGEPSAALKHQGEAIASLMIEDKVIEPRIHEALAEASLEAPYRVIGQGSPPDLQPNAVPRFVYFHLDHLGTPRIVTNADGTKLSAHHYMPFGQEIPSVAQASTNKRQFTGHERDPEAGLDYMVARYYSSSLGRFMVADPSTRSVRMELPQSWNRYSYVFNNPLRFTDPNGQWPFEDWVYWWSISTPQQRALGIFYVVANDYFKKSTGFLAALGAINAPINAGDQTYYDNGVTQVRVLDSGHVINQTTGLLFDPAGYENLPFRTAKNGFSDPKSGFAYQDTDKDGIPNKDDPDIDGDGTPNQRDPDPMDPNFGGRQGEEPKAPDEPPGPKPDKPPGPEPEEPGGPEGPGKNFFMR